MKNKVTEIYIMDNFNHNSTGKNKIKFITILMMVIRGLNPTYRTFTTLYVG